MLAPAETSATFSASITAETKYQYKSMLAGGTDKASHSTTYGCIALEYPDTELEGEGDPGLLSCTGRLKILTDRKCRLPIQRNCQQSGPWDEV